MATGRPDRSFGSGSWCAAPTRQGAPGTDIGIVFDESRDGRESTAGQRRHDTSLPSITQIPRISGLPAERLGVYPYCGGAVRRVLQSGPAEKRDGGNGITGRGQQRDPQGTLLRRGSGAGGHGRSHGRPFPAVAVQSNDKRNPDMVAGWLEKPPLKRLVRCFLHSPMELTVCSDCPACSRRAGE